MKRNRKGFTLVELVIVIAVIAILAAVLLPTFSNVIENAKQSSATQNATNAFKAYYATDAIVSVADNYDTLANYAGFTLYVKNGANADYNFQVMSNGSLKLIEKGTFTPATTDGTAEVVVAKNPATAGTAGKLSNYGYENVYIVAGSYTAPDTYTVNFGTADSPATVAAWSPVGA